MSLEIETKGPQDFVTAVDKEVELLIRKRLREAFPDHAILGEEFGLDKDGAPTRAANFSKQPLGLFGLNVPVGGWETDWLFSERQTAKAAVRVFIEGGCAESGIHHASPSRPSLAAKPCRGATALQP
nr:inositol monophosphatase family protein [uncultured Shinella sp.]